MAPKPNKPGGHVGPTRTQPSRKRQASNADEKATKRTRHDDDNYEREEHDPEEQHEEDVGSEQEGEEKVVEPPPARGGRKGTGVKKGPPQRYAGRDQ
jgi:hypothetical protein